MDGVSGRDPRSVITRAALAGSLVVGLAVVVLVVVRPTPTRTPPSVSVESVPWQLAQLNGNTVTVRWESGTCDPSLPPKPTVKVIETASTVALSVLVHAAKEGGHTICAGVGLGGTLSATLPQPIGTRKIAHAVVTDHDE
jgi:hypothetical protein